MIQALWAAIAFATPIYDPADLETEYATADLPPPGISNTDTTFQFTSNGVTITMTGWPQGDPQPISPSGGTAILVPSDGGFYVQFEPPVTGAGFHARGFDGCPGAIFTGVQPGPVVVTETVTLDGAPCTAIGGGFFGAVDLGTINLIEVHRGASYFTVDDLVFTIPGGGPIGGEADLFVTAHADNQSRSVAGPNEQVDFHVEIDNLGPDPATDVVVVDFLPRWPYADFGAAATDDGGDLDTVDNIGPDGIEDLITLVQPSMGPVTAVDYTFDMTTGTRLAPDYFTCWATLMNLAVASSPETDTNLTNNLSMSITEFDRLAVRDDPEICGNGFDDDCDGLPDCQDGCDCRPVLPMLPGADPGCFFAELQEGLIELGVSPDGCTSGDFGTGTGAGNDAGDHACTVPRGRCGNATVPAWCCDAATWSNPDNNLSASGCDAGIEGCVPYDPNRKDAVPGVNVWGYGYTTAGATIDYTIHYENIGTGDAHDVLVIDVLPPDLDTATLVIDDGGVYDADLRTITWTDPVVTPDDPRTVTFSADVRSDAPVGTHVRNVATIVFPDAVPPTRIDTNIVEHLIPSPSLSFEPDLMVTGCVETEPGSGEWHVRLQNDGAGFAYNVTATILNPPAAVTVTEGEATFAHPDDATWPEIRTVIPFATTTSTDTVSFTTRTDGDPCAALEWHLEWDDQAGTDSTLDVRAQPDDDGDAVIDIADNCVGQPNSDQADADYDDIGNLCDDDEEEAGQCGCSCDSSGGGGWLQALAAAALVLRRRRSAY